MSATWPRTSPASELAMFRHRYGKTQTAWHHIDCSTVCACVSSNKHLVHAVKRSNPNTTFTTVTETRLPLSCWTSLSLCQMFAVYVMCGAQQKDAVRLTLEQIDVVRRMCTEYQDFELVTSAQGIADFPLMVEPHIYSLFESESNHLKCVCLQDLKIQR